MGFFGQSIDGEVLDVPIRDQYELEIARVCVIPDVNYENKPVYVYIQSIEEEEPSVVAVLNPSKGIYQCKFNYTFNSDCSPLSLWTSGPEIHITGNWTNVSEEEEIHDDDEEIIATTAEDDEPPQLVELEDEINIKKRKNNDNNNEIIDDNFFSLPKKMKEIQSIPTHQLSPWFILPFSNEAKPLPSPSQHSRGNGLYITDYLIGNGSKVKSGSTIKLLYEGYFTDGYQFDANIRRKNPFSFRKSSNMVIKGLDLGIEGMKSGGAREIYIPSKLGYGKKGSGDDIPPDQDLVFRVRIL